MRRMRTVVLPVPAPASTSIGPLTCSIASRCCGSGWNLELEAPLETAIEEENSRVGGSGKSGQRLKSRDPWNPTTARLKPCPPAVLLQNRCDDCCRRNHRRFRSENRVAQRRRLPRRFTKGCEFLFLPPAFWTKGQQDGLCLPGKYIFKCDLPFHFRQ